MYPANISEAELKNKVAQDFFKEFDTTQDIDNIDFWVNHSRNTLYKHFNYLWAEAKRGKNNDIIESFVQLILTIGKKRTYLNENLPKYLGAFDCEKIAFIEYNEIQDIFNQNDFNWNVTPSNRDSKEFKQLYATSKELLESKKMQFSFDADNKELKNFIKNNFILDNQTNKIPITKDNFTHIYYKWCEQVAPSIRIDWEAAKPEIIDTDFYLADILSTNNQTHEIKKALKILLESDRYKVAIEAERHKGSQGKLYAEFEFIDNQKAHTAFWNLYERPPKEEFWDYIIDRRDKLVPVDVRERKGAFYTPQIWVQKAQAYLSKALGEDWREEYYVWDCAAGTGNLLYGLDIESYKIYASTLDLSDVNIMQDLYGGKTLLQNHIFQFDFLNDELFNKPCARHKKDYEKTKELPKHCKDCQESKLPKSLQEILKDEKKRKRLIIFINPPYAEAASATQVTNTGKNKSGVSLGNTTYERYKDTLGKASNELFAQFFIRIYKEIPQCVLASFSTLKYLNSSNFIKFRETFKAKFLAGFIAPANTFDNVKGDFPIGFLVWDLDKKVQRIGYNTKKKRITNEKTNLPR